MSKTIKVSIVDEYGKKISVSTLHKFAGEYYMKGAEGFFKLELTDTENNGVTFKQTIQNK